MGAVKIVGLTVLTGVSYGITNDMIGCRDCIEYFTVGHFYDDQKLRYRLVTTLNPNINAIVWGMCATPYLAFGAIATLIAAHINSRSAQKVMNANPFHKYDLPLEFQARWEACNIRNTTGYAAIGVLGVALAIGVITARIHGSLNKK